MLNDKRASRGIIWQKVKEIKKLIKFLNKYNFDSEWNIFIKTTVIGVGYFDEEDEPELGQRS